MNFHDEIANSIGANEVEKQKSIIRRIFNEQDNIRGCGVRLAA